MHRYLILIATLLGGTGVAAADAITIEDSLGTHTFEQTPQRVVALDWTSVENLIELGLTPLAMADTADYRTWVMRPELPNGIVDVGTRDAPNIERIARLKPDLIIVGGHQRGLLSKLNPIAPVLAFNAYSRDHNNYQASRRIFMQLATLFGKQTLAEEKLAAKDRRGLLWIDMQAPTADEFSLILEEIF